MTEDKGTGAVSQPPTYAFVGDCTQDAWHTELTSWDKGDTMQIATVNTKSHLQIEADRAEDGMTQFTGWRVTYGLEELRRLIAVLQNIEHEMATRQKAAQRDSRFQF